MSVDVHDEIFLLVAEPKVVVIVVDGCPAVALVRGSIRVEDFAHHKVAIDSLWIWEDSNRLEDELNVMVGLSNGESYQLEVTNLQGKLVHQENHTYDNGIHKLNTSEWNSGMYIVRVATEHATKHMKVVKK